MRGRVRCARRAGPAPVLAVLCAALALWLWLWLWLVPARGEPGFVLQAWAEPAPQSPAATEPYQAQYQLLNVRSRPAMVTSLVLNGAVEPQVTGVTATCQGRAVTGGPGGRLDQRLPVPAGATVEIDVALVSPSPQRSYPQSLEIAYRSGLRRHVDRVVLGLPGPPPAP